MGAEEERPDKVGVILDFIPEGNGIQVNTMQLFEVFEGRMESPFVAKWTKYGLEKDCVVLYRFLNGRVTPLIPNSLIGKVDVVM